MAQDNQEMRYHVNTYSDFSHNHLIAILSSTDTPYRFEYLRNEEVYSRFEVRSNNEVYTTLKQLIEENNGTSISIEYGTY